ncbi:MAG: trigger factor [Candidatus Yanofskybacteria bacterium]|nr:trigger factor [Candidatus Yanofskybacteria bacterium]
MQTNLKPIDNWTKELHIELDRSDLLTYIKETEKEFSSEVAVDGFRKGKAPQELMNQKLDKAKVLENALAKALEGSLAKALSEQQLDVRKVTDLKMEENTAEALRYNVKLHLFPEFSLPELNSVKAVKKEVSVGDKELQETLESVRNSRATFQPKEGPAAQGDRVEVDFQVLVDGKPLEGGESKNHPLIIGGKSFIPGFEEKLIGMAGEEAREFSLTAPDDYFQKEIAGKKLDFKVTMRKVQSVELPELNDAFAKTLGSFENLEQLKTNVKEGLLQEKKDKERQKMRLEILDALIGKSKIELPLAMVQEQIDTMVANFDADLHRRNLELNMYLAHLSKSIEDLRKEWQPEAERQLKIGLVIRKVAKEQNIQVLEEEVDKTAAEMLQSFIARGELNPNEMDPEALKASVRDRLINERTLEYIEKECA